MSSVLSFDACDLRPWGSQGLEGGFVGCLFCLQWGQLVLCIALVAVSLTTVVHSLSSPFLSFPLGMLQVPRFPQAYQRLEQRSD